MYDIFFIDSGNNLEYFEKIKTKYPLIKRVNSFKEAQRRCLTSMFWVIWSDIEINEEFKFDFVISEWDKEYVHVFKNDNEYNGICLIPKNKKITNREVDYRFFIDKKEIDIVASRSIPFEKYYINSYDEYLNAVNTSSTEMFWAIWSDIIVNYDFSYWINWSDRYNRNITHIFKNGEYYDGICLFSKNKIISKREFEYRFFIDKKEVDIVASSPKLHDIVFISYFEKFADQNYEKLKSRFVDHNVYHVKNIKGIHNAHIEAAKIVNTEMFWVVDADAIIVDDFNFNFQIPYYDRDMVHVWQSQNPINDLIYGYGGIKLLPKKLTINLDVNTVDMTTSISNRFNPVNKVSNITKFNVDEFNTWRSAFRECVKLSSKIISGQFDNETENRLNIWCTVGEDKEFGKYCIAGARAGREFGFKYKDDKEMLSKINNWAWLENEFQKYSLG